MTTPYYEDERATLYRADALAVLVLDQKSEMEGCPLPLDGGAA